MKRIYTCILLVLQLYSFAQFGTHISSFQLENTLPSNPWGIASVNNELFIGEFDYWGPGQSIFCIYDMEGNYQYDLDISQWAVPTEGNEIADLGYYQGTIFAMHNSGAIELIDPNTGENTATLEGEWANQDPKGIAYDPVEDVYYIGGWNTNPGILKINSEGVQTGSISFEAVYSLAWHPIGTTGDGTLFVCSQPGSTVMISEVNPQTGATIQSFIANEIEFFPGGLDLDKLGRLWVIEQENNKAHCYDTGIPMHANEAPSNVSNLSAQPDAGGNLEATLSWVNPTTTISGNNLTSISSVVILRNWEQIEELDNMNPGEVVEFIDSSPEQGFCTYDIYATNNAGEGLHEEITIYVGEDVPAAVSDFTIEQSSPGELIATLSWVPPSQGAHGGAFDEGVTAYQLIRYPDMATFIIDGDAINYEDNLPNSWYYYYKLIPFNSSGEGSHANSNVANIFDPFQITLESFFFDTEQWSSPDGENWLISNTTNLSGAEAPEGGFHYQPAVTGQQRFISPEMDLTNISNLYIRFNYSLMDVKGGYSIKLAATNDGGETLEEIYNIPIITTDGFEIIDLELDNNDLPQTMGSAQFQLVWIFDGFSDDIQYFVFDDLSVRSNLFQSINENSERQLQILPNPTTNKVYISYQTKTNKKIESIKIMDLNGKILKVVGYDSNQTKNDLQEISLEGLPKGLLFMQLNSNEETILKKIIHI